MMGGLFAGSANSLDTLGGIVPLIGRETKEGAPKRVGLSS
jgi:hypothetical protein